MAPLENTKDSGLNRDAVRETVRDPFNLPPADLYDPVVEAYKKDVDRTLLRENLKLRVSDRIRKFQGFLNSLDEWRGAAYRRSPRPQ